jgi:regulator of sirC expression with transglutaminase-like and TPR domain
MAPIHPSSLEIWLASQQGDPPLDHAAALIAGMGRPEVDVDAVISALDALTARLHIRSDAPPFEAVARLNHHLFTVLGFAGDVDSYDDPRNSQLDEVIRLKRGLPILLSVVYIEVARRLGVPMDGISFPGHFLVSPRIEPRFYIDAFRGGEIVRAESLRGGLAYRMGRQLTDAEAAPFLAPSPPRAIIRRMLNNLKGSWIRRHEWDRALEVVNALLALDPSDETELRDRELLLIRMSDDAG